MTLCPFAGKWIEEGSITPTSILLKQSSVLAILYRSFEVSAVVLVLSAVACVLYIVLFRKAHVVVLV